MGAKRILVVESEAGLRALVAFCLKGEGFEVTQASTREEARAIVGEGRPFDLVITDLSLPDLGGVVFAKWLRQKYASPRILLITGYDDEAARRFGLPLEFTEVLHKPFLPAKLLERVKELLGKQVSDETPGAAVTPGPDPRTRNGEGVTIMPEPRNGKAVLVIDDDRFARGVYTALLEEVGFEVVSASDGVSGIELFRKRKFDCVILDIYMPGLTGLDVIETLDPDTTGIPIIAISGSGEKTGVHPLQLAASLGAARTFGKDFEHEAFLQAVRELTGV